MRITIKLFAVLRSYLKTGKDGVGSLIFPKEQQ